MIKNIIFDIGNVLVDYCWREHIARFGFTGETLERIGDAMMRSPQWNEIDRGIWSNEELLEAFIKNAPELSEEIRLVFSDLRTLVRERPYSVEWIRSLKRKGYRTYYLSNYSKRVETEAASEISFLKELDGGILSYTVQLTKPDPAIYQTLLKRYALKAEESVFLDDTLANVEAARALGIQGILVTSQKQAVEELQRLLDTSK